MPELPEVEIVCRNLKQIFNKKQSIQSWVFNRKDLRNPIPIKKLKELVGHKIQNVSRRAKYIIIRFDSGNILVSHLGMTGAWRFERKESKKSVQKHDHIIMNLSDENRLVYNDPRRFGFVEVLNEKSLDKRFENLGIEPLSDFNEIQLFEKLHLLKSPIKAAIMNQECIVGVGNIYASEILFMSKVSPFRACSRVSREEYFKIFKNMKIVLNKAILKGGSTIENYRNSFGDEGGFQKEFLVYGRSDEQCPNCNSEILQKKLSGRSTFWCKGCQK